MGAPDAFAFRAAELAREGRPSDDEAVVDSFLDDLAPGGPLTRYLVQTQLAYRTGETLFLHGGLTDESLGHVPGRALTADVAAWIDGLNTFCRTLTEAFQQRSITDLASPPWAPLVTYQAPSPGQSTNPASVVYGRNSDEFNNPLLPSRQVRETLAGQGIRRLVLGHTPSGDTPALLRTERFELVIADNSRGRVGDGSSVTIEGPQLSLSGRVQLDGGEQGEVSSRTIIGEPAGPLGLRTRDDGHLVKGAFEDGRHVIFRGLPGYRLEQLAATPAELDARGLVEASRGDA
jgi:hypothetical protein